MIKDHITTNATEGKLYLQLLHGRKSPDEEMEDWGFTGPLIGPLKFCHVTYNSTINLGFENGQETGPMFDRDGFGFHEDMIFYDGSYYGDWELKLAK